MDNWDCYRTFVHIYREGSLSAAARSLAISHPTARRHLEELEENLGGALFVRSTYGLTPTDLAQRILPAAEQVEASIASITRVAANRKDAVAGVVRIAASPTIGVEILPGIMKLIRDKNKEIRFELTLSDSDSDLLRKDADIAIRMHRPEQTTLVAKKIADIEIGLFAHKDWVNANGLPHDLNDLIHNPSLIGQDRLTQMVRALTVSDHDLRNGLVLATDDAVAQSAAIYAAIGVGALQANIGAHNHALVRILPELARSMEMWLVTHPSIRHTEPTSTVFTLLEQHLKDHLKFELNR